MKNNLLFIGVVLVTCLLVMANCSNSTGVEEPSDEILFIPKSVLEDGKNKVPNGAKESPYACHVSTLANEEADYNYWNTSFWVHIPEGLANQAEGRTVLKSFVYGDKHAGDKARSFRGEPKVVRVAQCLLPDNEKVFEQLEKKFKKFGKNSWADSDTVKKAMNIKQKGEWVCSQFFITEVCSYNSQTGNWNLCTITDIRCIEWTFVMEEDDFPNGGGSGGPSDNPGDCDPNGLDPCFDEGDGNSGPPPTNTNDPCEVANPPVWCSCNDTGDPILDNLGIKEEIYNLFNASNANASNTFDRKEQGMWITKNPTTGEYGFSKFEDGWSNFTPCGMDYADIGIPSNTIGWVHSQPFSIGEKMFPCAGFTESEVSITLQISPNAFDKYVYTGAPSTDDQVLINLVEDEIPGLNLKSYIIDKDGITEYNENSPTTELGSSTRYNRNCY